MVQSLCLPVQHKNTDMSQIRCLRNHRQKQHQPSHIVMVPSGISYAKSSGEIHDPIVKIHEYRSSREGTQISSSRLE